MPTLADLICEETKTLAEAQALEVQDFIGHLKHKTGAAKPSDASAETAEADGDWAEFETLAGTWSGKFTRDACYDRPMLP
ncbi:hypothetical protein [Candidatus Thiodictyon syntrophicum]|nr:hypothetical protein [Candidatus Thiodictyon syntrophicum]